MLRFENFFISTSRTQSLIAQGRVFTQDIKEGNAVLSNIGHDLDPVAGPSVVCSVPTGDGPHSGGRLDREGVM